MHHAKLFYRKGLLYRRWKYSKAKNLSNDLWAIHSYPVRTLTRVDILMYDGDEKGWSNKNRGMGGSGDREKNDEGIRE